MATEFTRSKNGYEIRSDLLKLATDICQVEYSAKFHDWEISQKRNEDGSITTKVAAPEFPGIEQVLETAKKLYGFVNQKADKDSE